MKSTQVLTLPSIITSCILLALWVGSQAQVSARRRGLHSNAYTQMLPVAAPVHLPGYAMQPFVAGLPLEYSRFRGRRLHNMGHQVAKGAHHVASKIRARFGRGHGSRNGGAQLVPQYWPQSEQSYSVDQRGYNFDHVHGARGGTHDDYDSPEGGTHSRNGRMDDFRQHRASHHSHENLNQQISSNSLIHQLQMKVAVMQRQLDSMSDLLTTLAGSGSAGLTFSGNYPSSDHGPNIEVSSARSSSDVSSSGSSHLSETEAEVTESSREMGTQKQEVKPEGEAESEGSKLAVEEPTALDHSQLPISQTEVKQAPTTESPVAETHVLQAKTDSVNMSSEKQSQQEESIAPPSNHKSARLRRGLRKAKRFSAERGAQLHNLVSPSGVANTSQGQANAPISQQPSAAVPYQQQQAHRQEEFHQDQERQAGGRRGKRSRKMRRMAQKIRSYASGDGRYREQNHGFRLERAVPDMLGSYPVVPQV